MAAVYERYEQREAAAAHGRLRRPAAPVPARPARRPRVRPGPALALPAPVRRRVPGRQPAAAQPARRLGGRPRATSAWSATPTRPSTAGTAPTPTALADFADDHPGAETVQLTDNYRSSPQILAVANAVLAGGALDGRVTPTPRSRARCGPTAPTARSPRVTAYPDDTSRGPRPSPASLRDHHRPGGSWSTPGRAVSHQRPGGRDRAGAARHVASRSGCGAEAACSTNPRSRWPCATCNATRATCPAALTDLAAAPTPRSSDEAPTGRATSIRARPATAPRRAADDGADSRPANLEALARLGHDYLAVESRPTTAGFVAWLGETTRSDQPDAPGRRRRAGHLPRGQGPRVAGGAPGRHRAGPGADRPRPHRRRPGRGAPPVLRGHHPGRARAALHLGRDPHLRGAHRRRARASPYLDEVEVGRRAPCAAGDGPGRLGRPTWPPSGRRLQAASADDRARRRGGRKGGGRSAGGSTRPISTPTGQATFEALKAWRSRQAKAASVPAYVIFHDRVLARAGRHPARQPARRCWPCPASARSRSQRFGDEILAILADHAAS